MHLISTFSPFLLTWARRAIRSDQPSVARVPDTRYISELNFFHQHRRLFGWMWLDAPVSFRFDGRRWRNVEACVRERCAWVLEEPERDPGEAAHVLSEILYARLDQHAWMRCWLFCTVGIPIRYDDARDAFWGCGPSGSGCNRLGQIYMEYRHQRTPEVYRSLRQPFTFSETRKKSFEGIGPQLSTSWRNPHE
ncbi:MAG: hypothetical protein PF795_07010 [Kiritimatiellae bacterium]|jgi:predicted NAD-dependent protein-ADP-ribosyltransferase YbiA (DUF1768 family)|nr:hypothetical protein [Kiritimatiellia bacterium]